MAAGDFLSAWPLLIGNNFNQGEVSMHTYEYNEMLMPRSLGQPLISDLARKSGIWPQLIKNGGDRLLGMADLISGAVCDKPLYTVTLAKVLPDDTLKHHLLLTTPSGSEALQRRNELNEKRPFYGSKEVAQVIRREVMPRRWELWEQVSTEEIHLRCAWTRARALLRTSTPELMRRLHDGYTLPQSRAVYLQSEQVELAVDSVSTCPVTFTAIAGSKVTQKVEIRTPIVYRLDVNRAAELVVDPQSGVVARHPFQGDKLTLPERFARALWSEGIVLPLEAQADGKILVRLTDPELRTRLELSRWKPKIMSFTVARIRRIPLLKRVWLGSLWT
jgi:hypothetical protein